MYFFRYVTGSHSKRHQHRHGLRHRKPVWNVCEPSLCFGFKASCFLAGQLRILNHKCGVAVSPKEHHLQQDQVSSCCCLPTPEGIDNVVDMDPLQSILFVPDQVSSPADKFLDRLYLLWIYYVTSVVWGSVPSALLSRMRSLQFL